MALIAGVQAPSGTVMGHAGAYVAAGEKTARAKVRALEKAGAVVTNHPSKFGAVMKQLVQPGGARAQRRNLHALTRKRLETPNSGRASQRRQMHISESKGLALLREEGVIMAESDDPEAKDYFITLGIERSSYHMSVTSSYSIGGESAHLHARTVSLQLDGKGRPDMSSLLRSSEEIRNHFSSGRLPEDAHVVAMESLRQILASLITLYLQKEGSSFTVRVAQDHKGAFGVACAILEFDEGAQKCGRHLKLRAMRDTTGLLGGDLEAEAEGIVFVKSVTSQADEETLD